jgi:hypothetical protein
VLAAECTEYSSDGRRHGTDGKRYLFGIFFFASSQILALELQFIQSSLQPLGLYVIQAQRPGFRLIL